MCRLSELRLRALTLTGLLALGAGGCGKGKAPPLSHAEQVVRTAPVPPENAPQLGVVSRLLNIREYTDVQAPSVGVLRAGARIARSVEPVSRNGCAGGWYAVRPRGFVCVGVEATLDLKHPTLAAMALAPSISGTLPYTYARARNEAPVFERVPDQDDSVHEVGKLHRRAGMAVVGSWKAKEPSGQEARLALLTDGHFVRASDLEAARGSDFSGVVLDQRELPVAFVVKRGVRSFHLNGTDAEKGDLIEYHSKLLLTGRFRSLGSTKYWALDQASPVAGQTDRELWVRHQDVTVVQKRSTFPEFAKGDTHWLDVSTTANTLVAYAGRRALFTTLLSTASVAHEPPETGGETQTASDGPRPLALGTTSVRQKALTFGDQSSGIFGESFETEDVPWALELSSGQLLHGAYWHDRFGIEHGAGSLALAPADAAWVFRFVEPELPSGWHAVTARANEGTLVVIRR